MPASRIPCCVSKRPAIAWKQSCRARDTSDDSEPGGVRLTCVLVVEDDPWIQWMIADDLADRGYEVITAQDGLEARTRHRDSAGRDRARSDAAALERPPPQCNWLTPSRCWLPHGRRNSQALCGHRPWSAVQGRRRLMQDRLLMGRLLQRGGSHRWRQHVGRVSAQIPSSPQPAASDRLGQGPVPSRPLSRHPGDPAATAGPPYPRRAGVAVPRPDR